MTIEKKKNFIINIIYYSIIIGIISYILIFTFAHLMPFVFGFLIAYALKPVVTRLMKQFGEKNLVRIAVILVFYSIVALILFGLIVAGVSVVQNLASDIPTFFSKNIQPMLVEANAVIENMFSKFNPEWSTIIESLTSNVVVALKDFAMNVSASGISFVTNVVTTVPSMLISTLIAIISSFFFTLDYELIVSRVEKSVPNSWLKIFMDIKEAFVGTVGKYLVAYAKLMTLTFIELSLGFLVIGVSNPFGLAFLIAIVDILPVLGTGTIMIPWFVMEFILGNFQMGISLLIIYVIITVIRNILEPKVIGDQIGLHPIVTLICIYVGLRIAGFAGLFGLPIAVTIIKTLYDQGKLPWFKKNKDDTQEHGDEVIETSDK